MLVCPVLRVSNDGGAHINPIRLHIPQGYPKGNMREKQKARRDKEVDRREKKRKLDKDQHAGGDNTAVTDTPPPPTRAPRREGWSRQSQSKA